MRLQPQLHPWLNRHPELQAWLNQLPPATLTAPDALDLEAQQFAEQQIATFMRGIQRYHQHPYQRTNNWPEPVVRSIYGQLHHWPAESDRAPRVILIPSLINPASILDLLPNQSFVEYLRAQGVDVWLWNWTAQPPLTSTLDDYMSALLAAINQLPAHQGRTVLLGYCMGGNLALALANQPQIKIDGCVVLATAWDFVSSYQHLQPWLRSQEKWWRDYFASGYPLTVDQQGLLFAMLDPWAVMKKFVRFANSSDDDALRFVATEDWLSGGVPLPAKVAEECWLNWFVHNTPQLKKWRVLDQTIQLSTIHVPTLIVRPLRDRVVPPIASEPLLQQLPQCSKLDVDMGHISLMVSARAQDSTWAKIVNWLQQL